jgi:hypothetical protein
VFSDGKRGVERTAEHEYFFLTQPRRILRDYSRDLRLVEWGSEVRFARQQSRAADVRFGSIADIGKGAIDVRFTPQSRHRLGEQRVSGAACLLTITGKVDYGLYDGAGRDGD